MYEFIEGNIEQISPTHAVINNQGIGYLASISLHTFEAIKGTKQARLFIEQTFRVENQNPTGIVLYGFSHPDERHMFRLLTSVSGVGTAITTTSHPLSIETSLLAVYLLVERKLFKAESEMPSM